MQLARDELSKELLTVYDILRSIRKAETHLWKAQKDRDWSSVQDLATQLEQMWVNCKEEIKRIIFELSDLKVELNNDALTKLLEGDKDPLLANNALRALNSIYSEKVERKKTELHHRKEEFLSHLKRANLEHLWEDKDLSEQEFSDFVKKVSPQVIYAEKILDIEAGKVDYFEFMSEFPEENERTKIIEEIFKKIEDKSLQPPLKLPELISSITWNRSNAGTALEHFISALNNRFYNGIIDEKHFLNTVLPFIFSVASILSITPISIISKELLLLQSLNSIFNQPDANRLLESIETLLPSVDETLVQSLLESTKDPAHYEMAKDFLLNWFDFDPKIQLADKIQLLAQWLDSTQNLGFDPKDESQIECLIRLRDYLIDKKRLTEATFLVSLGWRLYEDERITEDFENNFYQVLIALIGGTSDSQKLVYSVLENPGWLMNQQDGVIVFLYLCYLGNFRDLLEQCRYQYFEAFERARKKHPVLVDEILLCETATEPNENSCSQKEIFEGIQAMEDLEHDLLKSSCFRAWPPAANYQKFFNSRICQLKRKIFSPEHAELKNLYHALLAIEVNEWIEDADHQLESKVKQPARDLMNKYISEQISRLRLLLDLRKKSKTTDLRGYLHSGIKSLRQLLPEEMEALENPTPSVAHIYRSIRETLQ